jgi:hypothetical protein
LSPVARMADYSLLYPETRRTRRNNRSDEASFAMASSANAPVLCVEAGSIRAFSRRGHLAACPMHGVRPCNARMPTRDRRCWWVLGWTDAILGADHAAHCRAAPLNNFKDVVSLPSTALISNSPFVFDTRPINMIRPDMLNLQHCPQDCKSATMHELQLGFQRPLRGITVDKPRTHLYFTICF